MTTDKNGAGEDDLSLELGEEKGKGDSELG